MLLIKFKSTYDLLYYMIIRPKNVFLGIKEGKYVYSTILFFLLCSALTFYKSYSLSSNDINFFVSNKVNSFFALMSNPQINWAMMYISYFLFILIIIALIKIFYNKPQIKAMFLALMSISAFGLIAHILFIILRIINIDIKTELLFYFVYFWTIILSIIAIRNIQNITTYKAVLLFVIPALFFTFACGLQSICPYIAWLTV